MSQDVAKSNLDIAMELAKQSKVGRSTSGRVTNLDRFVDVVLQTPKLSRQDITVRVAVAICEDKIENFDLSNEDHKAEFNEIYRKSKDHVAAAISNSKNNTSLSFNGKYKDVYEIGSEKEGTTTLYYLTDKETGEIVSNTAEASETPVESGAEDVVETEEVEETEEAQESTEKVDEDF